jgi:hypothetical protein
MGRVKWSTKDESRISPWMEGEVVTDPHPGSKSFHPLLVVDKPWC